MDNNRTILAVVLIVLLWSGYSLFFNQPVPVDNQTVEINTISEKKEITESQPVSKENISKSDTFEYNFNNSQKFDPITVKSDLYSITLSRQGATIKDIYLNKYTNIVDENESTFHFFNSDKSIHTLITSGSDGLNLPSDLVYSLKNIQTNTLELNNDSQFLVFQSDLDDYKIEKKYTFYPDRYDFDLEINIVSKSENNITGRLNLILNTPWSDDSESDRYSYTGPLTYNGDKLLKDKVKDIKENSVSYNNIVWSGFTTKYFISVINPGVAMERETISYNNSNIYNKFTSNFINIDNGEIANFKYSSYFGPKKKEYLSKSGNQYEEAIHYGFFHFLSQPLMTVLKFFYKYIGNYGFSIILLTICIKLLFWPLTQKSYTSMKGMQKLQPEMKKLREKFGDDKQRLNQEMMKFYKEHKVNPLGGCLPMVIQIPVFIALYRVLLDAIELRHAPFMLWLTDLSAKDPYYITPLVMGATMFLQQKMTPTNMDPTQEKIMLMMPIIFTFIFLNFPSGLVIYWLTNNILTIFQQYLIRRQPD